MPRGTDNIIKGFGNAVSILLCGLLSIFVFDFRPSLLFLLGGGLVCFAVYLYSAGGLPKLGSSAKQNPRV